MPKIYSEDLRKKALEAMARGTPLQRVSRMLTITEATLRTWRRRFQETGSYSAKRDAWGRHPSIKDLEKFERFVEEKPDRTQAEMAEEWGGVSESTIGRYLKKIGFTYKKKLLGTEKEMS
ncbi:MAG: IS630 transposase-related protein [Alphaproteobacteria bacterium]